MKTTPRAGARPFKIHKLQTSFGWAGLAGFGVMLLAGLAVIFWSAHY